MRRATAKTSPKVNSAVEAVDALGVFVTSISFHAYLTSTLLKPAP